MHAQFAISSRLALRAFGVFGTRVERFDDGGDAAAGAAVADDFYPDRIAGFDDVVENLVDDVLLEDAEVAIGEEILFEGLEFEAGLAGHVADGEAAEVGQAGLGADGGELGVVDEDLVGAELIAPGFDGREFGVEAGFGVVVGVAGGVLFSFVLFGAHGSILSGLGGMMTGHRSVKAKASKLMEGTAFPLIAKVRDKRGTRRRRALGS